MKNSDIRVFLFDNKRQFTNNIAAKIGDVVLY